MAKSKTATAEKKELTVEEKLKTLFLLQRIDSEIDKITVLRGELPLEVQDLEDEIVGLETRINNQQEEVKKAEEQISHKKNEIKEAENLIKKYKDQQQNVRNNREFDSLSKEIEFQTLEIQLCEKKIKEFTNEASIKNQLIEEAEKNLDDKKGDLGIKQKELEDIVKETQKEENNLEKMSEELKNKIEPRLLTAYQRIRENMRNALAVVCIERDACGGCFNKIPPQRQADIASRKKIIVCEYCGRLLVDHEMAEQVDEELKK